MSSIKLPHASGNSMSIAAPATNPSGDLTLTLPANIGSDRRVLAVNGSGNLEFIYPCGYGHFMAYLGSNQTVTNDSEEIVELNTVDGASGQGNAQGWYNNSTYKYTPQVAGVYRFHVNLFWNATTDADAIKMRARVRKNGSTYIADNYAGIDDQYGAFSHNAEGIVYMNGSSDYIEFRGSSHADDGTNGVLESGVQYTYGFGYLVEAA
jgi:hypothetical protein